MDRVQTMQTAGVGESGRKTREWKKAEKCRRVGIELGVREMKAEGREWGSEQEGGRHSSVGEEVGKAARRGACLPELCLQRRRSPAMKP